LCRVPPANNAINRAVLKLCVHSLKEFICFLHHKRRDKNNSRAQAEHTFILIAPAAVASAFSTEVVNIRQLSRTIETVSSHG
jgi:hypothetical protein